ncbi:MAG: sigma-70 family RNA polymerase sigma factor [Phycisphaera sp.]|nr:sigma-70 family RNA polymerase sigma factor [Phycisphaera sp.]
MSDSDRKEQLTRQLMAAQSRLYAYIASLVHNPDQAHDILQEANVVMLRKLDEVGQDVEFLAWAHKVCYFEVRGHLRDQARDRLRFDETLLERIAEAARQRTGSFEPRVRALFECLDELPDHQRKLIEQRYMADGSVQGMAEALGRPYGSVRQAIYRTRQVLIECVNGKLTGENA